MQLSNINISISINAAITQTSAGHEASSPHSENSVEAIEIKDRNISSECEHDLTKESANSSNSDLSRDDTAELIEITKATIGNSSVRNRTSNKAWNTLRAFNSRSSFDNSKNVDDRNSLLTVTKVSTTNSLPQNNKNTLSPAKRLFNSISSNIANIVTGNRGTGEQRQTDTSISNITPKDEIMDIYMTDKSQNKNLNKENIKTSHPQLLPSSPKSSPSQKRRRTNFTIITRYQNDINNDIYHPTPETIKAKLKRKCKPSRPLSRYVMERHWCLSRRMSMEEMKQQIQALQLQTELDREISELFEFCENSRAQK